jgi:hypothetical protein
VEDVRVGVHGLDDGRITTLVSVSYDAANGRAVLYLDRKLCQRRPTGRLSRPRLLLGGALVSNLADDLVDVPIRTAKVVPGNGFRALEGSRERSLSNNELPRSPDKSLVWGMRGASRYAKRCSRRAGYNGSLEGYSRG